MRHGLAHQHVDGLVIQHVARVVDDAVLAVRRVRVQRDVGNHGEVRQLGLKGAHGSLHEAIRVRTFFAVRALLRRVDDREQGNRRDAQPLRFSRFS